MSKLLYTVRMDYWDWYAIIYSLRVNWLIILKQGPYPLEAEIDADLINAGNHCDTVVKVEGIDFTRA